MPRAGPGLDRRGSKSQACHPTDATRGAGREPKSERSGQSASALRTALADKAPAAHEKNRQRCPFVTRPTDWLL